MATIIKNVQMSPELANIELGEIKLDYTKHAKEQMLQRNITYSKYINITKGSIVEIEQDSRTRITTKLVVRVPYDKYTDKVLVLMESEYNQQLSVITIWLNRKSDKHNTLDRARLNTKRLAG